MNQTDEESLKELGSLDTARLAIRGALSTIRSLQEIGARLKEQCLEEAAGREEAQARAEALEKTQERHHGDEARWREEIRLELREQEKERLLESERRLEEELSAMRSEVQRLLSAETERESLLGSIQKKLKEREAALAASEKDKLGLIERTRRGGQKSSELSREHGRELAQALRRREEENAGLRGELAALRGVSEGLRARAAETDEQLAARLGEKEKQLHAGFQEKEQALLRKYNLMEAELQFSLAELQNSVWQKTKDARETLNKAAFEQLKERERSLEARAKELEARHAEQERRLFEGWAIKEKRFEARFAEELALEKDALRKKPA